MVKTFNIDWLAEHVFAMLVDRLQASGSTAPQMIPDQKIIPRPEMILKQFDRKLNDPEPHRYDIHDVARKRSLRKTRNGMELFCESRF